MRQEDELIDSDELFVVELEDLFIDDDSTDDEPTEDDYITSDHKHFYQNGKLRLIVGTMDDLEEQLAASFAASQFWPNVWFVSDHGNFHRLGS